MTNMDKQNEQTMEQKHPLNQMMMDAIDQIKGMADTNTIVGQPINTPDGVTLIPISRVSFGFGNGGGTGYGKNQPKEQLGFGSGGGVKMEPVAFLVIKDGTTRVLPVAIPPVSTLDRIVEMVPDIMDKVEKYFDKSKEKDLF